MTGRVIVVGDVMNDVIVRPEGSLVQGSDRRATIRMTGGGSGANQAVWLANAGVAVSLVGRVGAGDRDRLAAALAADGVDPVLAGDPDQPTGTLVALVSPDGERSFFTERGANDGLCRADLPSGLLEGAALLHVSGYALVAPGPRKAVLEYMRAARAAGVPVSFDPASTAFLEELGPEAVLEWTGGAAFCFPNEAEAAVLTGTMDLAEQLDRLTHAYDLVVMKRSSWGAMARNRKGDEWRAEAPAVPVLDTTGAGDAFAAAFLAAHLLGGPVAACLEVAVHAGSQAATVIGARPLPLEKSLFRSEPSGHLPLRQWGKSAN